MSLSVELADGVPVREGDTCYAYRVAVHPMKVALIRPADDSLGGLGVRVVTREGDFRPDQVCGSERGAVERRKRYAEDAVRAAELARRHAVSQAAACDDWLAAHPSGGLDDAA